MTTVNLHEAKTRFFKLIEQIQRGEEVVIAKAGVPVARLTLIYARPLPDDLIVAFAGRES